MVIAPRAATGKRPANQATTKYPNRSEKRQRGSIKVHGISKRMSYNADRSRATRPTLAEPRPRGTTPPPGGPDHRYALRLGLDTSLGIDAVIDKVAGPRTDRVSEDRKLRRIDVDNVCTSV